MLFSRKDKRTYFLFHILYTEVMLLKWLICVTLFNLCPAFANLNQTISYSKEIPCESGSFLFEEKCYKLYGERNGLVFAEASNLCKAKQGSLVTINTKELQDFLTAFVILQKKINVWIGLHDRGEESVYTWDDGSVVNYTNWGPNEPTGTHSVNEDCVELRYKHNGKTSMWNDLTCDHSLAFICQSSKSDGTSSHDSRFCPIRKGGGWKYLNSCYHIVLEERSWDDAEKYCQENVKGHLLTILDPKEEMFLNYILSDYSKEFWIGIKIGNPTQQKWSSGWHVVYNNWSDEPKDSKNASCALKSHLWLSAPCSQTRPFICQTSTEKPIVIENGPEGMVCPDKSKDWIDLGGTKCYTFQNEYLKWDDANSVCIRKGGTLAIIESKEEDKVLHRYVIEPHDRMYIGLHRNSKNDDVFEWIDGTPYVYKNWRPNEPNSKDEKCGELTTWNLEWNDVNCNNGNPFLCSAKKTYPKLNQTYLKEIPCESGSYFFGGNCYKLFGEEHGLTWEEASKFCKSKHGSLASIHNKKLHDFLSASFILQKKASAWIGLSDLQEESAYTWDDGTAVNYTNWAPHEPHESYKEREDCVEIRYKHVGETSMWNDLNCDHRQSFICQLSESDTTTSPDSRFCPIETGGGWKYWNSCYHIVFEEKSWDDGEKYCQGNFKGHLLTILDLDTEMFLNNLLSDFRKEFWIGIKLGNPSKLKWSSGWHVVYKNWNDEQGFLNGTCALKSRENLWTSVPCLQTRPFICETSSVKPVDLVKNPEEGMCPDKSKDWIDLGGNKCYTFENENLNWEDANSVCVRKGGTLAIIESDEEVNVLHPYVILTIEPETKMYIGLHRSSKKDVFEWVDGTASDYRKWRETEPNGENEYCVELTTKSNDEWNDITCENRNPFLCSAKKTLCKDTAHGCCADGNTAAEGPDKAGCPKAEIKSCEDTVHGCCADGETVAEGPDKAGCPTVVNKSCTDTLHGCCPDGKTGAKGPNKAGCSLRTPTRHVPKDRGSDGFIPCDKGWFLFGEECFKVGGRKRNDRLSWEKAAARCQNAGGNLATIQSKQEQDFLTYFLLLDIKSHVWIGLNDRDKESDYAWNDGSVVNYTNWKDSEPTGLKDDKEDCVQMLFEPEQDVFGQWNDNVCSKEIPYICQMKMNEKKKSSNPVYCSSIEGGGWKFQNSCYHVVTEIKSWQNAEQHCKDNFNGHLVTVLDTTVDLFLDHILSNIEKELWIGIKIKNEFQQKWASGWYVSYDGLNKDHGDLIEGTCVLRKKRKQWTMAPCSKKHSFICEISEVRPPVLKPPLRESQCPELTNEWRDLGGQSCYYIETEKTVNWYEANFDCKRRGGHLLSIHSKEESEILNPFIKFTQQRLYVGLLRQSMQEDTFVWSDGSVMDYQNWGYEEPNNEDEKCGEIWTRYMEWNDANCEERKGYICSVRKVSPNATTVEKTECTGQVSYKALIGVSVCLLLVIILFGVVVYCSSFRNEGRRKDSTALFIRQETSLDNSMLRYRSQVESKINDDEEEYYESMH